MVRRHAPLAITVLYPRRCITRHYLNSFRGEPAISRFVWPFTPTHGSSTHFCNSGSFGPPAGVTQPSAWPWVDHLVSGLRPATKSPCSDSLSLRLRYALRLASECKSLTHYTKGTQSPLAGLPLFVCIRFQDLFHSPPGVLFAFPSRYWFTIGRSRVFSLGGWSPHLQTGLHVSRPTFRKLSSTTSFSRTGLSPAVAGLSRPFR